MSYSLSDIQKLLPSCCEVDAVSHLVLSEEENNVLSKFSKNFSTVLVFAHHVRHSWEWIWFEFDSISGGFIPPADLHLIAEIERIKELITYDELNITEIAWKMNYSSVAHLSNQFKKMTGLSPSHFKQMKDKRRSPIEDVGNSNEKNNF